jgi:catechol 2,3-dioxygenase-like lactoylglutathione lyase family enzyme
MLNAVHHIELWTRDLDASGPSFDWLLRELGWRAEVDPGWPQGRTWHHDSGVYVVLEASPDVTDTHDRQRAGLNHLALRVGNKKHLDELRAESPRHGWNELFSDRYPHAGGDQHTALFIENAEGFEVEIVTD